MKTFLALLTLPIIGAVALYGAPADGVRRISLLRESLSVPGREAVQILVEFPPGVSFPWHSHPGEELVFITKGALIYELEGKPAVRLEAGDVLFIPAGVAHTVRNEGDAHAAELATYIVEKDKPLLMPKE